MRNCNTVQVMMHVDLPLAFFLYFFTCKVTRLKNPLIESRAMKTCLTQSIVQKLSFYVTLFAHNVITSVFVMNILKSVKIFPFCGADILTNINNQYNQCN